MTPGASGNGRLGVQPIAPVLESDRASHGFAAPKDRLLLLRPPRYEADALGADTLPEVLTPQGAREGIVVVWEIASAEGRPVLPLEARALLRRRPATLDLLITYPSPSVSADHMARDVAEESTRAFRPIAVQRGQLNGHTAEVRQLLSHPPCSLATEIVELLIYRGLVMHSVHQQIAVEILRDVLTIEDRYKPQGRPRLQRPAGAAHVRPCGSSCTGSLDTSRKGDRLRVRVLQR